MWSKLKDIDAEAYIIGGLAILLLAAIVVFGIDIAC